MAKQARPSADVCVSSVLLELDIEARHRAAGFDAVPREVVLRRFFQFVDFLQREGMTTRTIAATLAELDDCTELLARDLTDEGFDFARQYHGRWLNRMFKDAGEAKEHAVLSKWLRQFRPRGRK